VSLSDEEKLLDLLWEMYEAATEDDRPADWRDVDPLDLAEHARYGVIDLADDHTAAGDRIKKLRQLIQGLLDIAHPVTSGDHELVERAARALGRKQW